MRHTQLPLPDPFHFAKFRSTFYTMIIYILFWPPMSVMCCLTIGTNGLITALRHFQVSGFIATLGFRTDFLADRPPQGIVPGPRPCKSMSDFVEDRIKNVLLTVFLSEVTGQFDSFFLELANANLSACSTKTKTPFQETMLLQEVFGQ